MRVARLSHHPPGTRFRDNGAADNQEGIFSEPHRSTSWRGPLLLSVPPPCPIDSADTFASPMPKMTRQFGDVPRRGIDRKHSGGGTRRTSHHDHALRSTVVWRPTTFDPSIEIDIPDAPDDQLRRRPNLAARLDYRREGTERRSSR